MHSGDRLLSFYGDDFTGSTDAMEALANRGFKTVLFLEPPSKAMIEDKFPDIQCIGVAGVSRTMNPKQMQQELKPVLAKMTALGTPIIHYKICSTFDSSREIGNIGKVMEMILDLNEKQPYVPIVAGVPALGRYTVFGNHFAKMGEDVYRLDKHPIMSKHPVTPMEEADLRRHLSNQTSEETGVVDILNIEKSDLELADSVDEIVNGEDNPVALLFDVLTDKDLNKVGKLIWDKAEAADSTFVIGSSGIEYALADYWKALGMPNHETDEVTVPVEEKQVLVVSGSTSSVTSAQIKNALDNGFSGIKISPVKLMDPKTEHMYLNELIGKVASLIRAGENVIVYSAEHADDPSIGETRQYLKSIGHHSSKSGELLGRKYGKIIFDTVEQTSLERVIIAGGDTSSYATTEMGVYALQMIGQVAPGAPLCSAYAENQKFNGLEIALKGGQLGQVDYFTRMSKSKER